MGWKELKYEDRWRVSVFCPMVVHKGQKGNCRLFECKGICHPSLLKQKKVECEWVGGRRRRGLPRISTSSSSVMLRERARCPR